MLNSVDLEETMTQLFDRKIFYSCGSYQSFPYSNIRFRKGRNLNPIFKRNLHHHRMLNAFKLVIVPDLVLNVSKSRTDRILHSVFFGDSSVILN